MKKKQKNLQSEDAREEQNDAAEDDKEERFDYDAFWKSLMEDDLYLLLKRVLPDLYAKVDTSRAPIFLDKELQDVLHTGDPKRHKHARFVDKLVDVPLIGGKTQRVLLHAEAQGKGGENIAKRMYRYKNLIFAHYDREPVAVVIVTHKRPANEPKFYKYKHFGTESIYRYNIFTLAGLIDEELLSSDNPMDLVLYAAKHAAECGEDRQRYHFLRLVTKLLAERGWEEERTRKLLNYISWILYIEDPRLTAEYREYLEQLEEENKVHIPFFLKEDAEKIRQEGRAEGEAKGEAKGKREGKLEMAKKLLADGFPPEAIAKSAGVPLKRILSLAN